MTISLKRREFLRLAGMAGAVYASGLPGCAMLRGQAGHNDDFYFLQFSDIHWGFNDAKLNPQPADTLKRAIDVANGLRERPDFVVFTGDLTHLIGDADERRRRLLAVREQVAALNVPKMYFLPGEHDASLDKGKVYKEIFGESYYSFDHKGIHFVALDNVSDLKGALGQEQIEWLRKDLARFGPEQPIVVFTHRPLFDLYPAWEWQTQDGAQATALLDRFHSATVFYGHIHREDHQRIGNIEHYAASSLVFANPAPGSMPKRVPVAWDAQNPNLGLGIRNVEDRASTPARVQQLALTEPVNGAQRK
jgi:3',5'-cyclic AMP phosphodiesterase CpdA